MTNSLWSLKDVSLSSSGNDRLHRVSVQIPPGITAVLGHSGAGKTSLLNLLVSFERPASGEIRTELPESPLPLFWVPQNGGLWNHLTAAEHIRTVDAPDGAQDWLESMELAHRAEAYPAELSQGERCRLSLARALAAGASVTVMDEPLASVDPARLNALFDVIVERCRGERSLVFATHRSDLVLRYAQRVICLESGTCRFSGPVQDLYENPADSHLAGLLGHGNWISRDESARWLDQTGCPDRVVRPEHLEVRESDDGGLRVVSSRRLGPFTETRLSDPDGEEKLFVHLSGRPLTERARVCIVVSDQESSPPAE